MRSQLEATAEKEFTNINASYSDSDLWGWGGKSRIMN
jgi:hypothetical protein